MIRVFLALFFSLIASVSIAQQSSTDGEPGSDSSATDTTTSNNAALAAVTGASSGFRFQGGFWHIPKIREDQEDTTDILARVDYTLNKKHRFRVQQFFTKFYSKYESEHEFKPTDTALVHFYRPSFKPLGMNLLVRSGLGLPISHESNRDDLITRFSGSLIASKAFFGGKAMIFAVPYARYHWYEYKTSASGRQLPLYTLGTSLTGLYFITPKLTFAVTGNYNFEGVNKSQFDGNQDVIGSQLNRGFYRFDLDLTYQITNRLSASLGYFQGANYMHSGRYELVFYDNENSRYSAGMTYIY